MSGNREWCWPWSHEWPKWVDVEYVVRSRDGEKSPTAVLGKQQERRCRRCNMLQMRVMLLDDSRVFSK